MKRGLISILFVVSAFAFLCLMLGISFSWVPAEPNLYIRYSETVLSGICLAVSIGCFIYSLKKIDEESK
jgi:hypothetical protein